MKIAREFNQQIKEEMKRFNLFDTDLTETTIIARDNGQIVAFAQEESGTVYEIESKAKGAGRAIVDWMQEEMDSIHVTNSGKDSWGFWEKMGFTQTSTTGYYAEWRWEYTE